MSPAYWLLYYLGISLLTFVVYAWDKGAARRNGWRTPERTLHGLALLGGWPGALMAQHLLRHKSRKAAFRLVFWLTVVAHLVLVGLLLAVWPAEWKGPYSGLDRVGGEISPSARR